MNLEQMGERVVTAGLSREHRRIEAELDALEAAAGQNDVARIEATLKFFDVQVALHRRKEEEVLFPALAQFPPLAQGPVRVMLAEHEEERRLLRSLAEACTKAKAGTDSRAEIESLVGDLCGLLRTHIMKEDRVLYHMAEQVLAGGGGPRVRQGLDALGYID